MSLGTFSVIFFPFEWTIFSCFFACFVIFFYWKLDIWLLYCDYWIFQYYIVVTLEVRFFPFLRFIILDYWSLSCVQLVFWLRFSCIAENFLCYLLLNQLSICCWKNLTIFQNSDKGSDGSVLFYFIFNVFVDRLEFGATYSTVLLISFSKGAMYSQSIIHRNVM